MKTKSLLLFLTICLLGVDSLSAQGFTPPSEGKAVIYFARVTKYGRSAWFKYFDNDQYLGRAKGQNYFRYECDPGKNLLWLSCDNREFLTTDIKAGETYIVIVDVYKGFNAVVGLTIIDPNNSETDELFKRAKEMINTEAPFDLDQKDKGKNKLTKFIKEELEYYEEKSKEENKYKHLSSEMAIPEENLK